LRVLRNFTCASKPCGSENPRTLKGEVTIHFPGLDGIDTPINIGFPRNQRSAFIRVYRVQRSSTGIDGALHWETCGSGGSLEQK